MKNQERQRLLSQGFMKAAHLSRQSAKSIIQDRDANTIVEDLYNQLLAYKNTS